MGYFTNPLVTQVWSAQPLIQKYVQTKTTSGEVVGGRGRESQQLRGPARHRRPAEPVYQSSPPHSSTAGRDQQAPQEENFYWHNYQVWSQDMCWLVGWDGQLGRSVNTIFVKEDFKIWSFNMTSLLGSPWNGLLTRIRSRPARRSASCLTRSTWRRRWLGFGSATADRRRSAWTQAAPLATRTGPATPPPPCRAAAPARLARAPPPRHTPPPRPPPSPWWCRTVFSVAGHPPRPAASLPRNKHHSHPLEIPIRISMIDEQKIKSGGSNPDSTLDHDISNWLRLETEYDLMKNFTDCSQWIVLLSG